MIHEYEVEMTLRTMFPASLGKEGARLGCFMLQGPLTLGYLSRWPLGSWKRWAVVKR